MNFTEFNLDAKLVQGIEKLGLKTPTKVQEKVINDLVANKDLIVQSETGSGKTLAYLIPIFEKYKEITRTNQVIVLVPTHELAIQVHKQVEKLGEASGILLTSAVIMGDVNIKRQIEKLREKPQIVIGTAGRILELIEKKKIAAHTVKTIVIDEADKLLEKNHKDMILKVIKTTMRDRQLGFFSASLSKEAIEDATNISKDATVVKTTDKVVIPKNIDHLYLVVDRRDKLEAFRKLALILNCKKAMVFINKVEEIEEATAKLRYHKVEAECLHGSNLKKDRKRVVEGFRSNKINYLVATDIAARGLHFDGVDTVFHISIPEKPLDYQHRAGRTGRNGKQGKSILIVTKAELNRIKLFEKVYKVKMKQIYMTHGKVYEVREKTLKK